MVGNATTVADDEFGGYWLFGPWCPPNSNFISYVRAVDAMRLACDIELVMFYEVGGERGAYVIHSSRSNNFITF